jgi:hypothetical protein
MVPLIVESETERSCSVEIELFLKSIILSVSAMIENEEKKRTKKKKEKKKGENCFSNASTKCLFL